VALFAETQIKCSSGSVQTSVYIGGYNSQYTALAIIYISNIYKCYFLAYCKNIYIQF